MNVSTIPAGVSFVDALARGLVARVADAPERLADTLVLLPTRRACRALAEAFLRTGDAGTFVLPRLRPVGDVDEDELAFEDPSGLPDEADLPPAIQPLERRLLLARLIQALPRADGEPRPMPLDQAARLAEELARLLDQVQLERLGFDGLARLVPEEHARHWQITLDFLHVLTDAWPRLLTGRGLMDPAERMVRLIERQAELWRQAPPATPVIVAGSTGTVPATADLMAVVAGLPAGEVVLPGLDRWLDEDDWGRLGDTHPQTGMARLLEHLDLAREQVADWPVPNPPSRRARARLVSDVMRPAETTEAWGSVDPDVVRRGVEGVVRVDCPGPEEEARVVALVLREVLERPDETAALVTPDRALARRVALELTRWGIEIDDSAGTPLAETPVGLFLRATARMIVERLAPVPLLAALKHPLAAGEAPPEALRRFVRRLERRILRGPRPAPGFEGLRAGLAEAEAVPERRRELGDWLDRLEEMARPLADLVETGQAPLIDWLRTHVVFAERLATVTGDVPLSGGGRLWVEEAGEAAAELIGEFAGASDGPLPTGPHDYLALLEDLMRTRAVRPRWRGHPRLAILGPLEARLLSHGTLVLGGLNEGTWPAPSAADPWMSRPMREDFGLPAHDRRIGLQAHDFAQAFHAPRLVLTRAERVEGTPTVPSRWLSRLDAVLKAAEASLDTNEAERWLGLQASLDRPDGGIALAPPRPTPPVAVRPREMSVTRIETWLRDPYAIYAHHVLGLKPLDPLDADPGAADYGNVIHEALDRFVRECDPEDPRALDHLIAIGAEAFSRLDDRPGIRAFWWPRFERIAAWFVETERGRRPGIARIVTEAVGRVALPAPAGPFVLTGKADRIGLDAEGRATVVDYKTGSLPSVGEVRRGMAPQLPLEGVILESGGFEGVPAGDVAGLQYWHLSGRTPPGEVREALGSRNGGPEAVRDAVRTARDGLLRWVAAFDDPGTPFLAQPRPEMETRFGDYDLIERREEWLRGPRE